MPLIVLTGIPSSGKTTRVNELNLFFLEQKKEVIIVSENEQMANAKFQKNTLYSDPSKEKLLRSLIKSEVLKLLTPQNVVILDALNYIKGYRYELYCGSKAQKSTQCTVHTAVSQDEAWNFNITRKNKSEQYDRKTFDALLMQYEEPDGKNRWDSPLFVVFPHQELNKDGIMSSLFDEAPPLPNMSTQNPALNSTNFLYDLDQITKKIVDGIINNRNMGRSGIIQVNGFPDLSVDVSNATVQQLMILRRQYLTYCKLHPPESNKIPQLFMQYLNSSLQ